MRMAKSIANERISYKVIPQSLPKIKFQYKLVEFGRRRQKIDWRASLATDEQRELFDRLKEFRAKLSKEKHLVEAYMVCKDEHLASIVQNPDITLEEIKSLPHSNNIMLKDFAEELLSEYQKILNEKKSPEAQNATDKESQNEADIIPF